MGAACPRIVIGGAGSGVGKTSLTLALAYALRRRGLRVQTFKVGPDYLDPSHLAQASGRPCYNLDGWMTSEGYVRSLFARASAGADIALIEGVMGLFDGASPSSSEGSTAEIAKWLDAPVLLVANAHGMARSLAALVKGFATLDAGVRLGGVLANQCGSARHGEWLAESLKAADLPPLLGAVARGSLPQLASRHLGLVTADAQSLPEATLNELADALERQAPLEPIMRMARSAPELNEAAREQREAPLPSPTEPQICDDLSLTEMHSRGRLCHTISQGITYLSPTKVRIGLAFDSAFHFYYPDCLELFEARGAEWARFSPLADSALPEGLDGLYLGGGYPEEHAEALAANAPMLEAVRRFVGSGRPVYAECGGLMYLSQGIETREGRRHALAGALPAWTRMLARRKALGYVEAELTGPCALGEAGARLRGHEFHYSELTEIAEDRGGWAPAWQVRRRRAAGAETEGFRRGNVLASYVHPHFGSRPESVDHFIQACAARD